MEITEAISLRLLRSGIGMEEDEGEGFGRLLGDIEQSCLLSSSRLLSIPRTWIRL